MKWKEWTVWTELWGEGMFEDVKPGKMCFRTVWDEQSQTSWDFLIMTLEVASKANHPKNFFPRMIDSLQRKTCEQINNTIYISRRKDQCISWGPKISDNLDQQPLWELRWSNAG